MAGFAGHDYVQFVVLRIEKVSFQGNRLRHASMESSYWIIFSESLNLIVRNQAYPTLKSTRGIPGQSADGSRRRVFPLLGKSFSFLTPNCVVIFSNLQQPVTC